MSHPEHLLSGIVQEIKRLFNVDCPIIFVDGDLMNGGIKSRGVYSFVRREMKISLEQNILSLIETICHEVVHYKQQCHKLLGGTGDHWWYRGVWYPRSMPYADQPWEHEANKYMPLLFSRFCEKASYKLVQAIRDYEVSFHQPTP